MNFINNSWDHDKAEEFRSDNQNFSCSAYDMFVYFHKVTESEIERGRGGEGEREEGEGEKECA